MRKWFAYLCLAFLSGMSFLNAQDIHFSQPEFTPLLLNPAMMGNDYDMRVVGDYRTQWGSVGVPFNTFNGSFDAVLNSSNSRRKGHLSAGINFFNDQAGDVPKITTNNANLHLGYQLMVGKNGLLGMAIYAGYMSQYFNALDGQWGNQHNGVEYNPNLPSGETALGNYVANWDAGGGLVYSYEQDQSSFGSVSIKKFKTGIAVYHLNRPDLSLFDNHSYRHPMRGTFFINAELALDREKNFHLLPAVYAQYQQPFYEVLMGTYFQFNLIEGSVKTNHSKRLDLAFGLFYRLQDAIIPKFMVKWSTFTAGFAYDLNVSRLKTVSQLRGGSEFFLQYTIGSFNKGRSMSVKRTKGF